jgi:hypothetical protein
MDKGKKGKYLILAAYLMVAGYLAKLIVDEKVRQRLRWFWLDDYKWIVYGSLILGFILIIFGRKLRKMKIMPYLKHPYYLIFLPLGLFPVLRCYFNVPYIFCEVCPKPCPWGVLRKGFIPAFLLQNADCRSWCYKFCPFGSIQDLQCSCTRSRIKLPKWLIHIRWLFLAFAIVVIFGPTLAIGKNSLFLNGNYDLVFWTGIVALLIFLLSFFIPRFWCNYFCPIGSFGDLTVKGVGKIRKKKKCD